jgi:hypothetical protein
MSAYEQHKRAPFAFADQVLIANASGNWRLLCTIWDRLFDRGIEDGVMDEVHKKEGEKKEEKEEENDGISELVQELVDGKEKEVYHKLMLKAGKDSLEEEAETVMIWFYWHF